MKASEIVGAPFELVRTSAPGVTLWPEWLLRLRRPAYRGSREGRDAETAVR